MHADSDKRHADRAVGFEAAAPAAYKPVIMMGRGFHLLLARRYHSAAAAAFAATCSCVQLLDCHRAQQRRGSMLPGPRDPGAMIAAIWLLARKL